MTRLGAILATSILVMVGACGDDGANATGSSEPSSSTTTTDPVPSGPGFVVAIDASGDVPVFSWEARSNASGYAVLVLDADSSPVWVWTGSGTSVAYGDLPDAPAAASPELVERFGAFDDGSPEAADGLPDPSGLTLIVLALDGEGEIVAGSDPVVVP
ncbi:MAG: hypothetical protein R3290_09710 [Acidimicrobiia bacterium]|nr:hypothetical protein [Acidimicrobiia bacterium]